MFADSGFDDDDDLEFPKDCFGCYAPGTEECDWCEFCDECANY